MAKISELMPDNPRKSHTLSHESPVKPESDSSNSGCFPISPYICPLFCRDNLYLVDVDDLDSGTSSSSSDRVQHRQVSLQVNNLAVSWFARKQICSRLVEN